MLAGIGETRSPITFIHFGVHFSEHVSLVVAAEYPAVTTTRQNESTVKREPTQSVKFASYSEIVVKSVKSCRRKGDSIAGVSRLLWTLGRYFTRQAILGVGANIHGR